MLETSKKIPYSMKVYSSPSRYEYDSYFQVVSVLTAEVVLCACSEWGDCDPSLKADNVMAAGLHQLPWAVI
jgi:hypothetical protein